MVNQISPANQLEQILYKYKDKFLCRSEICKLAPNLSLQEINNALRQLYLRNLVERKKDFMGAGTLWKYKGDLGSLLDPPPRRAR